MTLAQDAKKELADRELSRRHLLEAVKYHFKDYDVNWHHEVIAEKLELIESGELKRLIITMPPRHGKSELASVHFPAWYVGRNPDKEIIAASYSSDLSGDFGRKVRNMFQDDERWQNIFPDVRLAQDSKSASKWNIRGKKGAYLAVGVGGAATGKGADVLILDDVVKNRQEAESPIVQQSIFDWYTSTARTRLSPNGAVVVIMCMTGDTKVLMIDGSEKELRDICVGDKIKTYDNGKLSSSIIKNWINHGSDRVFTITMKSGKIVKANERHPFLILKDNTLQWIRVKNLKLDQKIVTVKDKKVNGRELRVTGKDAKNQLGLKDIVPHITIKKSGLVGIVHHLLTISLVAMHISNIVTALRSKIMTPLLSNKMVSALSADDQKVRDGGLIINTSALTTITKQEKSGDYSAMSVILESVTQRLKRLHWLWQNTSDFTLDEIISIEESGVEEVFDIEVDKTGNFIANGVVSHNTRWHDSDLVGRLLMQEKEQNRHQWEVINFPAIAEKNEEIRFNRLRYNDDGKLERKSISFHRAKGSALWPTRFSKENLLETKKDISQYDWSSLYQQNPVDSESTVFEKGWFQEREEEKLKGKMFRRFLTVDTAGPMTSQSNYTGVVDNRVDTDGMWNIKAMRYQISAPGLIDLIFALDEKNDYEKIGIEKTIFLSAIKPFLEEEAMKRNKPQFIEKIFELQHNQIAKEIRIRGLLPFYKNGRIYHVKGECDHLIPQLRRFPKGTDDDLIDALAYQTQIAEAPLGWNVDAMKELERADSAFDPHNPISQI